MMFEYLNSLFELEHKLNFQSLNSDGTLIFLIKRLL